MKYKTHVCFFEETSSIHLITERQANDLTCLLGVTDTCHLVAIRDIEHISDKDYYPLPGEELRYIDWLYNRRVLR